MKKSIKVLLIYPPSKTQSHETCPMGMLMLAAVLEDANYKVRIIDANAQRNKKTIEQIVEIASNYKPDVIGITLVTPMILQGYKLAKALRATGAKLLAGGPHATMLPEEAIEHSFDAAVVGEGETTIIDAIKGLLGEMPKEEVKGWVFKDDNGKFIHTEPRPIVMDLDELPLPARHLINTSDYYVESNPEIYGKLFSSRGCSGRCSFCSGGLFGKKFRFRSPDNLLDEIKLINKTYGTKHFHFVDDAMTMNKDRIKEFCTKLKKSNLNITWGVMTRIDAVDHEILKLMAESNCKNLEFGIESGNPETLKKIHKPHSVKMVKQVLPKVAELGMNSTVYFILGFPWEDVEALEITQKFMDKIAPYVNSFSPAVASILVPFPCTEIYEKYKDEYGFEDWWLEEEKSIVSADPRTCSYFESKLFWVGHVLTIDFFKYSDEIKFKIFEIFKLMYFHKISRFRLPKKLMLQILIQLSINLYRVSPAVERLIFRPMNLYLQKARVTI